jgi:anti-sigma factor RsiW
MSQNPDVTCREVLNFLSAYLDGELPEEEGVAFERHIAACDSCIAYIQSYQQTIELSRGALAGDEEPDLPEDLIQAVLAARRP